MQAQESMVWSAACGAMAVLTLLSFGGAVRYSTWATWRRVVWFAFAFHFLLFHSGMAAYLYPGLSPQFVQTCEVALGPLWLCMSTVFLRYTLRTWELSRAMDVVLLVCAFVGLCLLALIMLVLSEAQQLTTSTGLSLGLVSLLLGVSLWAVTLGDVLSWGVAGGLAFSIPVLTLLQARPLHFSQPLWMQSLLAMASVLNAVFVSAMTRPRNYNSLVFPYNSKSESNTAQSMQRGASIAKKMLAAQRRQMWVGGPAVIIGIAVFQTENLLRQYGEKALNSLYARLEAIIDAEVGSTNPVGRFGSSCFIVLIETTPSPEALATLINTLGERLKQPLPMRPLEGASALIHPDIGIGSVNLTYFDDVNSVLLDAHEAAEVNRMHGMPDLVTTSGFSEIAPLTS